MKLVFNVHNALRQIVLVARVPETGQLTHWVVTLKRFIIFLNVLNWVGHSTLPSISSVICRLEHTSTDETFTSLFSLQGVDGHHALRSLPLSDMLHSVAIALQLPKVQMEVHATLVHAERMMELLRMIIPQSVENVEIIRSNV